MRRIGVITIAITIVAIAACGDIIDVPAPIVPDASQSVYVSPLGTDAPGCGTDQAPCKTIARGIAARDATHSIVVVGEGSYGESVELVAGLVLSGGWKVFETTAGRLDWRQAAAPRADAVKLVPPPGSAGLVAKNIDGSASVSLMYVVANAASAPSGSAYGVFVLGDGKPTTVALEDVHVVAGPGGDGVNGTQGSIGSAGTGTCAFGSGLVGLVGAKGESGHGAMGAAGWVPSRGKDGTGGGVGNAGGEGTPPGAGGSFSECLVTIKPTKTCMNGGPGPTVSGNPGEAGCGGNGGSGGSGGVGGGASFAVFAFGAKAVVSVTRGTYTSGRGGAGGAGGSGGSGGPGAVGVAGEPSALVTKGCAGTDCESGTYAGGGPGGTGGQGGLGGQGGGGDGGPSAIFARGAGASIAHDGSVV